jgi:methanogenic corrinoid protein MtbC1
VIIGGAPITAEFCRNIKADGYSPDSKGAAELAESLRVKVEKQNA